jgi:hypothetical protein
VVIRTESEAQIGEQAQIWKEYGGEQSQGKKTQREKHREGSKDSDTGKENT